MHEQVPGYRAFDAEGLEETDRAYAWEKLADTSPNERFSAYTSTYQNAQGQIFTIMMEVMKEKFVIESFIQGKDMVEVSLNGKQALYGESQFIWFSPTDENRSLWPLGSSWSNDQRMKNCREGNP